MDASNFSIQLDISGAGLIETIEDQLFQRKTENMKIKAEPYKLNVYGEFVCVTIPPVPIPDVIVPI